MQTKHYVWLAVLIGLIIGIIGWLAFAPKSVVAPGNGIASSTTTDLGNGVQIQGTGTTTGAVISESTNPTIKPPAIKPITFSADIPADAKTALQANYQALAPQIQAAPTRVDLWLQLAVLYKIGGDYNDAITVWNYVAAAAPSSSSYIAYGDLGDLYLNFIHDYAKAEVNYKAAVALQPGNADYQAGLKAAEQAQGQ
jgi:hypothetical protein